MKKVQAAIKIQSYFRGFLTRKALKEYFLQQYEQYQQEQEYFEDLEQNYLYEERENEQQRQYKKGDKKQQKRNNNKDDPIFQSQGQLPSVCQGKNIKELLKKLDENSSSSNGNQQINTDTNSFQVNGGGGNKNVQSQQKFQNNRVIFDEEQKMEKFKRNGGIKNKDFPNISASSAQSDYFEIEQNNDLNFNKENTPQNKIINQRMIEERFLQRVGKQEELTQFGTTSQKNLFREDSFENLKYSQNFEEFDDYEQDNQFPEFNFKNVNNKNQNQFENQFKNVKINQQNLKLSEQQYKKIQNQDKKLNVSKESLGEFLIKFKEEEGVSVSSVMEKCQPILEMQSLQKNQNKQKINKYSRHSSKFFKVPQNPPLSLRQIKKNVESNNNLDNYSLISYTSNKEQQIKISKMIVKNKNLYEKNALKVPFLDLEDLTNIQKQIIQISKSPRFQPVFFEFDVYIKAAVMIQKIFRGYNFRKYNLTYYIIKKKVLLIENFFYYLKTLKKKKVKEQTQNLELASNELISLIKMYFKGENEISSNFSKDKKIQQTIYDCRQKISNTIQKFLNNHQDNFKKNNKSNNQDQQLQNQINIKLQKISQLQQELAEQKNQNIKINLSKDQQILYYKLKYEQMRNHHKTSLIKYIDSLKYLKSKFSSQQNFQAQKESSEYIKNAENEFNFILQDFDQIKNQNKFQQIEYQQNQNFNQIYYEQQQNCNDTSPYQNYQGVRY